MTARQYPDRIAAQLRKLVSASAPMGDGTGTHRYMGFDIPVDLMLLTGGGAESFRRDFPMPHCERAARICGDDAKLSALGWSPRFDLESGVRDAIAWWRECSKN